LPEASARPRVVIIGGGFGGIAAARALRRANVDITLIDRTNDFIIVAPGSRHHYFGHDEWESYAPGLKAIEDASEIRRRFLLAYEIAEKSEDPQERDEYLTFVIVGGGPRPSSLPSELLARSRRPPIFPDKSRGGLGGSWAGMNAEYPSGPGLLLYQMARPR
jgi:hypothetical protein